MTHSATRIIQGEHAALAAMLKSLLAMLFPRIGRLRPELLPVQPLGQAAAH